MITIIILKQKSQSIHVNFCVLNIQRSMRLRNNAARLCLRGPGAAVGDSVLVRVKLYYV